MITIMAMESAYLLKGIRLQHLTIIQLDIMVGLYSQLLVVQIAIVAAHAHILKKILLQSLLLILLILLVVL